MATLFPSIQTGLGYEIIAVLPTTVAPVFPAAGITHLSGGAEPPILQHRRVQLPRGPQFSEILQRSVCAPEATYSAPLVLGPEQSNITIETCGGVTLTAGGDQEKRKLFLTGMIHLNGADNITLRGLTFDMARIVLFQSGFLGGLNRTALETIGEAGAHQPRHFGRPGRFRMSRPDSGRLRFPVSGNSTR